MASLRGEGMATRKDRLAKIKKGPGVFVYDGKSLDTEWIPTVKKIGRQQPVFDASGMPVLDSSGRQIYERPGQIARDLKGQPILGGVPEKKTIKIDVRVVRGVSFPVGKKVSVSDESLAVKLRCMPHFSEVESGKEEVAEISPEPIEMVSEPKTPRGRPKKIKEW